MSQQTEKSSMVIADDAPHHDAVTSLHPGAAPPLQRVVNAPRRRFTAHVAWTLGTRLLMVANSLAASIIIARWLGADGLGALAVLNVTVALMVQIGCAGLPSANIYFIAQDRKYLAPAWSNALVFALACGGTLAFCIIELAAWKASLFGHVSLELIAVAAVSIPFQLITLLGINIFLGVGSIGRFNLLDTVAQSFTLVNAVVALVLFGTGLWALVFLNTGTTILMGLLLAWMIGRLIAEQSASVFRPDVQLFKRMARYSIKFHIPMMAWMIVLRADLLIVNHFRGAVEAGVYAVASQATMALILLPAVIATLLMPRAVSERDASGQFTMRATRHTAFVMLIVCLMAAPASLLLPLLFGAAFADASLLLLMLLPGVYLIGLELVLVQHFNSVGLPVAIPLFWLMTLVTNVTLNLALVPVYGARAAAATSTLSYAMIFALVAFYFRLKTGNRLSMTLLLRRDELRDLFGRARLGASAR